METFLIYFAFIRYSGWLFSDDEVSPLFASTFHSLLQAMIDPKAIVQQAACSALCSVMSYAADNVTPYASELLAVVQHCFGVYGVKCTMLLYDTISTLADSIGDQLQDPALTQLYLPILIRYQVFVGHHRIDSNIVY